VSSESCTVAEEDSDDEMNSTICDDVEVKQMLDKVRVIQWASAE